MNWHPNDPELRSSGWSRIPDCPAGDCDKPDHDECWREYERQENEYKYRPVKGLF